MRREMVWAGALIVASTLAACGGPAPQHTEGSMLSGTHNMPGSKAGMSNEYMPERAFKCSEAELATMPPEHRQACLNALNAQR